MNQSLVGDITSPQVGITNTGRFAVLWIRPPETLLDGGLILRWFDATGAPDGAEEIITREYGFRRDPSLAVLGDGRTMVVWQSEPYFQSEMWLAAQRWDSTGNTIGMDPW